MLRFKYQGKKQELELVKAKKMQSKKQQKKL